MKDILKYLFVLGAAMFAGFRDDSRRDGEKPDGKTVVKVEPGAHLAYAVKFHGRPVINDSPLGVIVESQDLGADVVQTGKPAFSKINERYVTRGVHDTAVNQCNVAVVPLAAGASKTAWQLEVRVFNDGVACRYRVPGTGRRLINGESTAWNLPVGTTIWHQGAGNRSYEGRYNPDVVGQMPQGDRPMAPAALVFPDGAGYGLMTEANLVNYSDMALQVEGTSFKAVFHDNDRGWDNEGEILSPWRVMVLAADLNTLVNCDVVRNLCPAPAPELADASWIKPGRAIWHWLICGRPKLEEQKEWIDGTARMGYEFYLIDDGWRDWNGGGDNAWSAIGDLVKQAQSKGVQLWAWVDSKYVFKPEDRVAYFKRAAATGLVGLKIDFPHPASAEWVKWYDDTLRDAAAAHLLIDFHGALKPTGRERTWPNELTREAICGREQGKLPATHDTALPFLRFVQGHADYTPTLLIPEQLKGSSLAHELAMSIVFTSPFLCMGDHPNNYLKSEAVDVLKALPAVWNETRVLPGSEIGELAAFARRSGDQWFVGAINGEKPGRETVNLGFLGKGRYKVVELADSPARNDAFVRSEYFVTRDDKLVLPLRRDGGFVAWLVPVK